MDSVVVTVILLIQLHISLCLYCHKTSFLPAASFFICSYKSDFNLIRVENISHVVIYCRCVSVTFAQILGEIFLNRKVTKLIAEGLLILWVENLKV